MWAGDLMLEVAVGLWWEVGCMGPFSLLGLNRPSRQLAGSFEGKRVGFPVQAPVVYPP